MYAELVSRSNYSFLRGASHPEELVARAAELGLSALAIADDDGLYGLVKAHLEAKARGLKLLLASSLTLEWSRAPGPGVVLSVEDATGYANLCELISESRLSHPKGEAGLDWRRVAERSAGLWACVPRAPEGEWPGLHALAEAFPGRFSVGVSRHLGADDEAQVARAGAWARALGVPLLAHNDVHTHARERQPLQDVLTAIRCGTTVAKAGTLLFPNAERTLKSPADLRALFADLPEAVDRTLEVAHACRFTLDELQYQFSEEALPPGLTRQRYLVQLVEQGLRVRYPAGVPDDVRRQIAKELHLIEALDYAGYFLSLWDIVRFAREKGILCQGRGSAANSAVCHALQITAIDPVRMGLLFERFLSMERREPLRSARKLVPSFAMHSRTRPRWSRVLEVTLVLMSSLGWSATSSFDWDYVDVQPSGNAKCSRSGEVTLLPYSLSGRCSATWCSKLVVVPLVSKTTACNNSNVTYGPESVAPYLTGWRIKAPYTEAASAGAYTQIQHLEIRFGSWQVSGGDLELELIYSLLHSDDQNYPDWSDVVVGIEVVAADPQYPVVIRPDGMQAADSGSSAKASLNQPVASSLPYFFSALTGFSVTVDHGQASPFSRLGGSITDFGLDFRSEESSGVMYAELECVHESEPQAAISTVCAAQFVEVYADPGFAERATVRTSTGSG